MEKLTYDDAFVMEIVVNRINDIIEEVQESEVSFDSRLNSNWKSHRLFNDRLDKLEVMVKKLLDRLEKSDSGEPKELKDGKAA